jgi:hypothetical protein
MMRCGRVGLWWAPGRPGAAAGGLGDGGGRGRGRSADGGGRRARPPAHRSMIAPRAALEAQAPAHGSLAARQHLPRAPRRPTPPRACSRARAAPRRAAPRARARPRPTAPRAAAPHTRRSARSSAACGRRRSTAPTSSRCGSWPTSWQTTAKTVGGRGRRGGGAGGRRHRGSGAAWDRAGCTSARPPGRRGVGPRRRARRAAGRGLRDTRRRVQTAAVPRRASVWSQRAHGVTHDFVSLFKTPADDLVELIVQLGAVPAVVPLLALGDAAGAAAGG